MSRSEEHHACTCIQCCNARTVQRREGVAYVEDGPSIAGIQRRERAFPPRSSMDERAFPERTVAGSTPAVGTTKGGTNMRATGEKPDPVGPLGMAGERSDDDKGDPLIKRAPVAGLGRKPKDADASATASLGAFESFDDPHTGERLYRPRSTDEACKAPESQACRVCGESVRCPREHYAWHEREAQIARPAPFALSQAFAPDSEGRLVCSFCKKNQCEVTHLIAGVGALICNECIALSADIVSGKAKYHPVEPAAGGDVHAAIWSVQHGSRFLAFSTEAEAYAWSDKLIGGGVVRRCVPESSTDSVSPASESQEKKT